ncbi:bifunctional UDP-sugar hydrolase/5'-nucleotidase [uncultured Bifidobacterium sp.]|uniref:bifunctional metallophosphatase/5'-nucleotidase n=1 Tax=uncultured Bifidobacterium sp. TaxID=165187 RepID=UPI002607520E|nr:5'-nucleotidase C-terminal domain-containing protein [uncultured Bifidobacterium sp.]
MTRYFRICYTSDTHGHIFPVDYATGKEKNCGLLNMAVDFADDAWARSAVRVPQDAPMPRLVMDGGDTLQGTPYSQMFIGGDLSSADAEAVTGLPHPIATAFNAAGYEFVTLGNHDFNYGAEPMKRYLDALDATCVCANVHDLTGELPIRRYAFKDLPNGIRLGITGLVTDWVNVWEDKRHLTHLEVTDTWQAAQEMNEFLKDKCDISICIYHGGYERDVHTGEQLADTTENRAWQIAHDLDFDLLLSGHQHISMAGADINGTVTVQTCNTAVEYAELACAVDDNGKLTTETKLTPVGSKHNEEPYATLSEYERRTRLWIDHPVGSLTRPIAPQSHIDAALHGNAVAALFNAVQLDVSGARVSCASIADTNISVPANVSRRNVFQIYPFANSLAVLSVTRDALKGALERCASYFDLEHGVPVVSERFLKPKVEHYNYDYFAGISYTFDLSRPLGDRVVNMKFSDGSDIPDNEPIELVCNSYRATGTGGYEMLAQCPTARIIDKEMPDLIISYLREHAPVDLEPNGGPHVIW